MADEKNDPPSAAASMPRVRRRAPTIDLKATEVVIEPQAAPPEYPTEPPAYETGAEAPQQSSPPNEPPPPPPRPASWRFADRPIIGAALAGGLAALVVFVMLWLGGLFSGTENASDQRLAAMETKLRDLASRPPPGNTDTRASDDLNARLTRLESAAASPGATGSAGGIDAEIKMLQTTLADLARRSDDNAAAIREARGQAEAALSAANTSRAALERNDVEALSNRVATLERNSKTLSDEVAKSLAASGDRALRAAVAAQALRAAVERGDPFAAELSAAKALAAEPQTLAPLEPFASSGLPSAAALARRLTDITPAMLQASAAPAPSGGFLDRLQANAEKLVRIRPIEETPGDKPAAVISRAQAKAARSDLSGAAAELNALPEAARAPAGDWIKQVEARNAALNASRRFAADATIAIGKASP
jgi:hypothetical protein